MFVFFFFLIEKQKLSNFSNKIYGYLPNKKQEIYIAKLNQQVNNKLQLSTGNDFQIIIKKKEKK